MFEVQLFQSKQNKPLNELQISKNDLSVLDSSKYNILDEDEIATRKKEVLAVIDKITVDKLVLVFTRVFANILTSNENKQNFEENKKTFHTIFRAARFVRDLDPSLLERLTNLIYSSYEHFLDQVTSNATPDNLADIKGHIAAETYLEITHPDTKKFEQEKVEKYVRGIFPQFFNES